LDATKLQAINFSAQKKKKNVVPEMHVAQGLMLRVGIVSISS
jgi:hypothetical protein